MSSEDVSSSSSDEFLTPPLSVTSSETLLNPILSSSLPEANTAPVPDVSLLSLNGFVLEHPANVTLKSDSTKLKLVSLVTVAGNTTYKPPIAIRCEITDEITRTIVRYAAVQFHHEGQDASGIARRTHNASSEDRSGLTDVKYVHFCYENALVYGVDNVPIEWPQNFKDHLNSLAKLRADGIVSLQIPSSHNAKAMVKDLIDSLNKAPGGMWSDFKHTDGRLITSWEFLEDHFKVDCRSGGQEYKNKHLLLPASDCYASPEEARLKLTHGVYAEYLWEQQVADNVCEGTFNARFYQTTKGHVLVEIQRHQSTETKLREALDDNMLIEIRTPSSLGPNGIFLGAGKITPSLPLALNNLQDDKKKFVLLLYAHSTTPSARQLSVPVGKTPPSKSVKLTIKDYESSKLQIDAINTFFDGSSKCFQKWWPGFLGDNGGDPERSNWLKDDLGVTQQEIDAVVRQTARLASSSGMVLNEEQMNILGDVGSSYGGWSLWRGPPGTGKTTVIALMIYQLLQFEGVGVYACSPSNGSVNRLYACISALMRRAGVTDRACWPLRIFRKYNELRYLKSVTHPHERNNDDSDDDEPGPSPPATQSSEIDDIVLDEWCKLQQKAEEKRLMNEPKNGLMAAVIEAIRRGDLQEAAAARSTEEPEDAKQRRQQQDFQNAQESLGPLRNHLNGSARMNYDKSFLKHIANVRDHILGDRRLTVSTVGNAQNLLVRNAIFRNCKKVAIVVDEQSLDNDAGAIALLAGLIDIQRVMREFGGESPIVQLIMVGDQAQGAPLIRSFQEGVNPCGAQLKMSLFARMLKIGYPVKTLWEQHRMAPIIRSLPSDRCYGGKLRDSLQVQQRALSTTDKKGPGYWIPQIMKTYPVSSHEDDCRHLLIDVPDSYYEIEEETRSKTNPKNLAATILLMKFLIGVVGVNARDIIILVFYRGQKRAYEQALMKLESRMRLKKGSLFGCVQTSDAFQGRERPYVILDVVATSGYRLGNVGDKERMNVACSRARDHFFVVGTLKILEASSGTYVHKLLKRLKAREAFIDIEKLEKFSNRF